MQETLMLSIDVKDEVDQSTLDRLTRQLRDEISRLDVEYARLSSTTEIPHDAKGDPITIGSIVVALASAGVFTGLLEMLKSWALRREGRLITIKAEVDGRKIEMTFSPAESSEKEMISFAEKIVGVLEPSSKKK